MDLMIYNYISKEELNKLNRNISLTRKVEYNNEIIKVMANIKEVLVNGYNLIREKGYKNIPYKYIEDYIYEYYNTNRMKRIKNGTISGEIIDDKIVIYNIYTIDKKDIELSVEEQKDIENKILEYASRNNNELVYVFYVGYMKKNISDNKDIISKYYYWLKERGIKFNSHISNK